MDVKSLREVKEGIPMTFRWIHKREDIQREGKGRVETYCAPCPFPLVPLPLFRLGTFDVKGRGNSYPKVHQYQSPSMISFHLSSFPSHPSCKKGERQVKSPRDRQSRRGHNKGRGRIGDGNTGVKGSYQIRHGCCRDGTPGNRVTGQTEKSIRLWKYWLKDRDEWT